MVRSRNYNLVCTTLLVLLVANGCSDPDKTPGMGLAPPTALSVTPTGAGSACLNAIVSATFSEAMNPATINASTFTLIDANSVSVSGLVTYNSASNTAVFTTSSNLATSTSYTATITTGAKDTFGNALATHDVWTFTTGVSACSGI